VGPCPSQPAVQLAEWGMGWKPAARGSNIAHCVANVEQETIVLF